MKAAAVIDRGARLAGWAIKKHYTAGSGSSYLKLRRGDGARLTVRVADHDRKDFRPDTNRIDCRTQPADLLRALRTIRYHDHVEPENRSHESPQISGEKR